ncbi:MAG: sigma-54-dependent Fis family transcriptional regulator, partial [Deltaproteobacteria bacterium]|nr:sigma-54-dependent Fis family transcriptional regulator [Deltaproteobacteria bacterium]
KQAVDRFKREYIERNLQSTQGNRSKAAKILEVQRTYLSRLITKYGL